MVEVHIWCPNCGMISYNLNDVRERYCGRCKCFHDGVRMAKITDWVVMVTLKCGCGREKMYHLSMEQEYITCMGCQRVYAILGVRGHLMNANVQQVMVRRGEQSHE